MQSELEALIDDLFRTLKERNIDNDDTFLQNMISYLYESGRKVYQTNDRMADKLSRIIRESDSSKSGMTKRIIQEIKNKLVEVSKNNIKPDISLVIDDETEISIPFERKITFERAEDITYQSMPESNELSIADFATLGKLFGNVAVDRKLLEENIRESLNGQGQITLNDVVERHPLKQGLPELFAYFGVLNHFPHKSINEEKLYAVVFDNENNKYIQIPEIIISR